MSEKRFVVNAGESEVRWVERAGFGKRCLFERVDEPFAQIGIQLSVIAPGDHSTAGSTASVTARSSAADSVSSPGASSPGFRQSSLHAGRGAR